MGGSNGRHASITPGRLSRIVAPTAIQVTFDCFGGGLASIDHPLCIRLCTGATDFFGRAGAHVTFIPAERVRRFDAGAAPWSFVVTEEDDGPPGHSHRHFSYDAPRLQSIGGVPPPARGVRVAMVARIAQRDGSVSPLRGIAVGCDGTLTSALHDLARTIVFSGTRGPPSCGLYGQTA